MRIRDAEGLARLDFAKGGGLLPVVAQHAHTGEVLMVAWADRAALERTLRDGLMWYWSRSRGEHWRKGDTSGNAQRLVSLHGDCDADTVLALVEPAGPSCHTGEWSCFGAPPTLPLLDGTIAARAADEQATGSYTRRLLENRNLRLKKLGEEAVELALALADGDPARAAEEAADVLYHVLVACRALGVGGGDILRVLADRAGSEGSPRA